MNPSPRPWSTFTDADFTYLVDAQGKRFAKFADWQDAEFILSELNSCADKIKELEQRLTDMEEDMSEKIDNKEEEISKLVDEMEAMKDKL